MKKNKQILVLIFIFIQIIISSILIRNNYNYKEEIINLNLNIKKINGLNNSLDEKIKEISEEKSPNKVVEVKKEILEKPIKEMSGLVLLKDIDNTIVEDIRYATSNNFVKRKVYTYPICILTPGTAIKLKNANITLNKIGYKIKIYDGYRPIAAQSIFWSLIPDERYVANPSKGGSDHSKGCAVDVTLVDKDNRELNMPTLFDDFSSKANRSSKEWTEEEKKNVRILTEAMKKAGFIEISGEWWHYYDSNKGSYKTVDVPLEYFLK